MKESASMGPRLFRRGKAALLAPVVVMSADRVCEGLVQSSLDRLLVKEDGVVTLYSHTFFDLRAAAGKTDAPCHSRVDWQSVEIKLSKIGPHVHNVPVSFCRSPEIHRLAVFGETSVGLNRTQLKVIEETSGDLHYHILSGRAQNSRDSRKFSL